MAWEDKTSIDCALAILGSKIREKILVPFLTNKLIFSLSINWSNWPINIDWLLIKFISSLDGELTFKIISDLSKTSFAELHKFAPFFLYT